MGYRGEDQSTVRVRHPAGNHQNGALVKELGRREEFESLVCVTAQHRQMLDQVLEAFAITPDYDLDIMKPGQTLSDITARVLQGLEGVVRK